MALFLETSAVMAMVFREEGGLAVQDRIRQEENVWASRLLRVEAERTLIRFGIDRPEEAISINAFTGELKLLWSRVMFHEITREICDLAGRIAPGSRLRSLDAIHVATFHHARKADPSLEMLSFDERILREI